MARRSGLRGRDGVHQESVRLDSGRVHSARLRQGCALLVGGLRIFSPLVVQPSEFE